MQSTRYYCNTVLIKLGFSRQIFRKIISNTKFHEIPSSGSRVVQFGRTDRHDDANSRFSAILRTRLKTSQSMLNAEIIAVCSQIHTKHINTLCGQNLQFITLKLVVQSVATWL